MSRAEAAPAPRLPGPDLPAGFVWPAASGREVLRRVPRDEAVLRDDLVGRQGLDDGSGTSDVVLVQAGAWCLKTSSRRRFADLEDGRAALLALVRRKLLLGSLLPRDTVLALVPGENEEGAGAQVWTVCPWVSTLRRQMGRAVERGDAASLASALAAFATAAVESMALAVRQEVQLDVHPSNFALTPDGLWYVDDDIGHSPLLPAIAHSLLRRVDEYSAWEAAVDVYLSALEESFVLLSADEVQALGLAAALDQVAVRTPAAEEARERLRSAVWRCPSAP